MPGVGSQTYDAFWGSLLRLTTVAHKAVHRISGGRLWRRFPGGGQVVWITTLGRRSGEWRTNPLLAAPDGSGWVIAGSNAGQEKVPGWVFNVRAHPRGRMELDGTSVEVVFEELDGDEARRAYGLLVDRWSGYAMYARNIGREIPVFRMVPQVGD